MLDDRVKEIRRILTGFITYEMDGTVITAAKNIFELQSDGIFAGSDNARLLGLRTVKRQYQVTGDLPSVHTACIKAFNAAGARVYLYTAPDALAALCHVLWFNPLLITLETQDDRLLLCVYTARALTAAWSTGLLLKRLNKSMPEGLAETEVTMTPQCVPQEKPERRLRKKKAEASPDTDAEQPQDNGNNG